MDTNLSFAPVPYFCDCFPPPT